MLILAARPTIPNPVKRLANRSLPDRTRPADRSPSMASPPAVESASRDGEIVHYIMPLREAKRTGSVRFAQPLRRTSSRHGPLNVSPSSSSGDAVPRSDPDGGHPRALKAAVRSRPGERSRSLNAPRPDTASVPTSPDLRPPTFGSGRMRTPKSLELAEQVWGSTDHREPSCRT